MADEPTVTPQGSLIETGSFAALVLQAAQHPDSAWRMEGSGNWPEKPGRLTVWVDLDEAAWDEVFDRLNELYDENGVRRGLAPATRNRPTSKANRSS